MPRITRNVTQTPVFVVAAFSTFISLNTIHGWRPTSVTTHPASIVITDSTPAHAAIRRNHFDFGRSCRNHQYRAYQADRRNSRVPRPTITSHARCTVFASEMVGWSPVGNALRPWITVLVPVLGSDKIDA